MAKHAFEKFIHKEATGAKKKELIKQEKRQVKKEARAAGEEFRKKKREERFGSQTVEREVREPKHEVLSAKNAVPAEKPEAKKGRKFGSKITPAEKTAGYKEWRSRKETTSEKSGDAPTPHKKRTFKTSGDNPRKDTTSDGRKIIRRPAKTESHGVEQDVSVNRIVQKRQPVKKGAFADADTPETKPRQIKRPVTHKVSDSTNANSEARHAKPETDNPKPPSAAGSRVGETEQMPLNKYIAHCGVCARREAAELVKHGKVSVNGSIIYEPGFKVTATDTVRVKDKEVFLQHNPVYILLNKPKDYLTTAKDPEGRKTVFDLVANATKERVFPVGRLDRNTTGVLLLTNDGELAQKLTHPSYEIKKIYEVKLDKDLTKRDFEAIVAGVTLEDGFVAADSVAYADANDKSIVGIEIHSGRNRIVRRIFEHLGYDVKGLDRVMFANLTKKNVDRGKYRFLSEREVRLLKFMNQSFLRKGKEEDEFGG
jgi:23S rRNA pseudouridine2605 synthase